MVKDSGHPVRAGNPARSRASSCRRRARGGDSPRRSITRPVGAGLHHPRRHARDPARHHRQGLGPAMSEMRAILARRNRCCAICAATSMRRRTARLARGAVGRRSRRRGCRRVGGRGPWRRRRRSRRCRWRSCALAGRHAAPVPLAETMLAAWLLSESGLAVPAGAAHRRAGACARTRRCWRATDTGWRLRGEARRVPWARDCAAIAVLARDDGAASCVALRAGGARLALTRRRTISPASRATMRGFDGVRWRAEQVGAGAAPASTAMRCGGAARWRGSRLMAGALETGARPDGALCRRARAVRPRHRQVPGGAAGAGRARRQRRRRGRRRRRSHGGRGSRATPPSRSPRQGAHQRGRGALADGDRAPGSRRDGLHARARASTASPRGCGRGARSSATRAIGGAGSAAPPARSAATGCGRSSRKP